MNRDNQYKYISQSTRVESPLQRAGVIALEIIRLILAVVFIFSGFVKAIDPAFELVTTEENGTRLYTIRKK